MSLVCVALFLLFVGVVLYRRIAPTFRNLVRVLLAAGKWSIADSEKVMREAGLWLLLCTILLFILGIAMPESDARVGVVGLSLLLFILSLSLILTPSIGDKTPTRRNASYKTKRKIESLLKNDPEFREAMREALKEDEQ